MGIARGTVISTSIALLIAVTAELAAQTTRVDLTGMWSDPPATLEDSSCFFYCSDVKIERLYELLDDPANDERPMGELIADAGKQELTTLIEPALSSASLASYPIDPADDPGFLNCEPWGIARQVLAPHQLQITQHDKRVDFHYGEWSARRTIFLDGRERPGNAPHSLLGFSVGHYDGDALVVETTGIRANITLWWAEHSDRLELVERYRRSPDGERLLLEVTMRDPDGLLEPLLLKKVWGRAPEQTIGAYDQCRPATDFIRGTIEQF